MSATSDTTTHVARRIHRCSWCAEHIQAGEKYARYRWWSDDDVGTCRLHIECVAAMREHAADEGGWVEFEAGDNPRGCRCGFDANCDNPRCVARMAAELADAPTVLDSA